MNSECKLQINKIVENVFLMRFSIKNLNWEMFVDLEESFQQNKTDHLTSKKLFLNKLANEG